MKIKVLFAALTLAALSGVSAAAEPLSGKWCGDVGEWKHTLDITSRGTDVIGSLTEELPDITGGKYALGGEYADYNLTASAGPIEFDLNLRDDGTLAGEVYPWRRDPMIVKYHPC